MKTGLLWGAFYQIFFKALKVEKLTLFFSLISVNFVGSSVVLARVHVIPDERQKTILSPPLPRQQWLSSLSFMLSHSIIFFQDLVNFVRS